MSGGTSDLLLLIESNIWLYSLLATQDAEKARISNRLRVDNGPNITLSSQVVTEIVANLIKKSSMSEADIRRLIVGAYARYKVIDVNEAVM